MRRSLYVCLAVCSLPYLTPSKVQQQALYAAIVYDCQRSTSLMLEFPKIDPSLDDNKALDLACVYGRASVVQMLLDDDRVSLHKKNIWFCSCPSYCSLATPVLRQLGHEDVIKILQQHKKSNPYSYYKHQDRE